MKFLARVFIILAFIWLAAGLYQLWLHYSPNRLSFNNYHSSTQTAHVSAAKKQRPIRVSIKELTIDLPLTSANVTNNTWQTTETGASYLASSPIPGTQGNSIIYGHNWASLFGNLVHAKPGQKIVIEFADHSKKTFIIQYTSRVSPNESTILAPSKDKRITLYTCTGWFDSQRFVVVAVLAI